MEYGINDIETLTFTEGIRSKIAMYLGSADMQGVYNAIQEIISNSVDEYLMGYGNKIEIKLFGNHTVSVRDYGRSVPFGTKEDGTNVLIDIYSKAHTGGKFNQKVYSGVAGTNGIGAKATCLSSEYFKVISYRDGMSAEAIFKKGIISSYVEKPDKDAPTGTYVIFKPDQEVYNVEKINIDFGVLCEKCRNLSYLTKGLVFEIEDVDNNQKKTYCAKNGLVDLIKDTVKNPIHKTPISFTLVDGDEEAEIAMQWTANKEEFFTFTNGLYHIEGGSSLTGMKTAITTFMKKQLKGEFDTNLFRSGLVYAVSCKTPAPSFANQTKTKINNTSLRGLAQRATGTALQDFATRHKEEFEKVLEFLTKMKKAEQAAERARKQALDNTKEVVNASKKGVFDVDKLADAEYLGEDAVLLLVEGKSAGGAMQRVRDPKKYGILKLRGKIINALSNDEEEVIKNEEIRLFLKAMGINIINYKDSKLRYGRVAICVDADSDGSHIACLIIAMLYKLAPQFLKEGRLCWLHAPLFKVTKGNKTSYYYTEEELKDGLKGSQTRFKGLGEMKDEDARCMFNENQRLEPLVWSDDAAQVIEQLMSSNSEPKKNFIFTRINFEEMAE